MGSKMLRFRVIDTFIILVEFEHPPTKNDDVITFPDTLNLANTQIWNQYTIGVQKNIVAKNPPGGGRVSISGPWTNTLDSSIIKC
jgi:hypothetical protein